MKSTDQLRNDVEQELAWEPELDDSHIALSVKDGAVTMAGHVPTYSQKLHAVRAVERVSGVRAVADELKVRLVGSHIRDDTDIAESIAQRLAWHATIPRESVKAEVAGAVVTLRGAVEWEFQRREAVRLARDVIGVRNVINLIELKPGPVVKAVERQIAGAFGRQASLDARGVHVTVHDSTAVLTGQVHSIAEQRIARSAAYAAPGIATVESHLTVDPMTRLNAP
jgi:osmotically-inducible protein OsmY